MMYYDELARQDEQVLLTLTMDEEAVAACAERDPADDAAAAAVRTPRLASRASCSDCDLTCPCGDADVEGAGGSAAGAGAADAMARGAGRLERL